MNISTVILAGDERLPERFRHPELLPLGSRIKTRLTLQHRSKKELLSFLENLLEKAGNPTLMSKGLMQTLAAKAMGNFRTMVQMSEALLMAGIQKEVAQLDEKLFMELFQVGSSKPRRLESE